jgi:surface protein
MVTPPRGDVRRCRAGGRYGSCCCGYIFYILATLATYGNAAVFAPRTKWELHEAVARCLGGCMAWHQNRTDSSKCLAWGNQTAAAACRLLASADVSRVTCFADLFSDATGFNQDLSTWNVNSATDMQRMFHGTRAFRQSLCSPAWQAAMENGMVIKTGMFGGGSAGGIYCCPRGDYYVAVTRRCHRCAAGFYQDEISTNPTCKACVAGTFSTFGVGQTSRTQCLKCGAGRYSDEGPGQYQAVEGAAQYYEVCKPCEAGFYSLAGKGQTSARVCRACEAGRYQDNPGSQVRCQECAGGRYSDAGEAQVSEATCKNCAANTWMTPASGKGHNDSASCVTCKLGRRSDPGLLAEECQFDYFAVLGPVLGTIFVMLSFMGIKVFKRKVWDVAFGKHDNDDDRYSNSRAPSSSWKSARRRTVTRPSPTRTVALMKQAKKKKAKRPRPVAMKPEVTFEERFVGDVI